MKLSTKLRLYVAASLIIAIALALYIPTHGAIIAAVIIGLGQVLIINKVKRSNCTHCQKSLLEPIKNIKQTKWLRLQQATYSLLFFSKCTNCSHKL